MFSKSTANVWMVLIVKIKISTNITSAFPRKISGGYFFLGELTSVFTVFKMSGSSATKCTQNGVWWNSDNILQVYCRKSAWAHGTFAYSISNTSFQTRHIWELRLSNQTYLLDEELTKTGMRYLCAKKSLHCCTTRKALRKFVRFICNTYSYSSYILVIHNFCLI